MANERSGPAAAPNMQIRPPGPGGGPSGPGRFKPREKPKAIKPTIGRIWKYLRAYWALLVAGLFFTLFSSGLTLTGPYLIGRAVNLIGANTDFQALSGVCITLLAVYILNAACSYAQMALMVRCGQNTVFSIRKDLFGKLQELPLKFFDSKAHGELMSRVTNDVDNISGMLNTTVSQLISSIVQIAGAFAFMVILSPLLTVASLATVPLVLTVTRFVTGKSRGYFSRNQKVLGSINGRIEEIITGQKTIKVFAREAEEIARFIKLNDELTEVGVKAQTISGFMGPLMNVCNNLGYVLVVALGAYLVINGRANLGLVASFTVYARQFARPINELGNQYNSIMSGIAGGERVFEVIDTQPEPPDASDAIELNAVKGDVLLKDVCFSYIQGTPVLRNISLRAEAGQTIALVGYTGAGKTTIINLLTRFYDIDSGEITIDGVPIKRIKRNFLRSSLGFVLQDTYLFAGSIKENIRYGNLDASDEAIINAAKLANAHDFIRRLPQSYDTKLTENADNLSQGQKQMLAIARVVLLNPSILILDEATSNVDTRTELKIQEAMHKLMKGRTCFVIAHRLSTIQNADLIAVINGGEIIEQGTHEELIEKRGFYYSLYTA